MALENRSTDDLVRIAAAGGGFVLNASTRTTDDLTRIAAAANRHSSYIEFRDLVARPTDDLVRIAAAGAGSIVFSD